MTIEQSGCLVDLLVAADRRVGQIFQLILRRFQPFFVRLGSGKFAFDLFVLDDTALLEIDEQHLARLQPPFAPDFFLRHR